MFAYSKNGDRKDDGNRDILEVEQKQEKGKKNTQPDLPITALVGIGNQIIALLKFLILICICHVMLNVYDVMRM